MQKNNLSNNSGAPVANSIQCPSCNHEIALSEAILARINQQAQTEIENRIQTEREKISRRSEELLEAAAKSAAAEREKAEQTARILREEAVAAAISLEHERQAQQEQLRAQREQNQQESMNRLMEKITQLQTEKELLAERERLSQIEARQQAEAAAQQRISTVSAEIEQRLQQESEFRVQELNLQLNTLRNQLATANQRANQISQQNQGAALEASIEEQLRGVFPRDIVADVPAGVNGADIMMDVVNDSGNICGRILFETKRTASFSNEWTTKLNEDMHRAKADIGVIITQTMPRDMKSTGFKDGVWVADFATAMTLVRSLRWGIQESYLQKRIAGQSGEASAMLYDFVTSNDFRNRVQTILKTYSSMRDSLLKERRSMDKMWKTREAQLDLLATHTTHLITNIEVKTGHQLEGEGQLLIEDVSAEHPELVHESSNNEDLDAMGEIFIGKLRQLGGSAGNKSLCFDLIWDVEKFNRVKEYLIQVGLVARAPGKGGSVRLVDDIIPVLAHQ